MNDLLGSSTVMALAATLLAASAVALPGARAADAAAPTWWRPAAAGLRFDYVLNQALPTTKIAPGVR
jgi:hypothetical protein